MKGKGKRPPLVLILALIALATSVAASGTLAKYSSSFSGWSQIQVAAFTGEGTANFQVLMEPMTPQTSKTVPLVVRNYDDEATCQVKINYEIQVHTTGNLPLEFTLNHDGFDSGGSVYISGLDEDLKGVGGVMPASGPNEGKQEHEYYLVVNWPEEKSDEDYSKEIDVVTVTVTANQTNMEVSS